jgi:hypothetical protein
MNPSQKISETKVHLKYYIIRDEVRKSVFQTKVHLKYYIIRDEVHKGESGSPIHISTDEQIRRHFDRDSIQDERVCVLKLELMETTSLLKKEEMTPRLGGSTRNIFEDIHFQD